jgi:hypothetical protein
VVFCLVFGVSGGAMTGGGEEQGRRLFGVSLTDRPVWQQFLICSSGFFFGYLVNGICEVTKSSPPSPSDSLLIMRTYHPLLSSDSVLITLIYSSFRMNE